MSKPNNKISFERWGKNPSDCFEKREKLIKKNTTTHPKIKALLVRFWEENISRAELPEPRRSAKCSKGLLNLALFSWKNRDFGPIR